MSTTTTQDPPRCKRGWLKWAKAQMHPKYAEVQDLDFQLRRVINAISWDKMHKRVHVKQEPPYMRLLVFLGNTQNNRMRPPSPVDCEAVRIMNGGEFPDIISSLLRNAGWEPSLCTDPYLIAIERILRPPPPPPPEKEKEDLAPKELIPWMEWAKRQKNPAFDDAPERAELEDNLEAVRWNVKTPKCYKLQQPFIFLMGRWGPDGERGPDDVPSVIDLEATRIMNNGKLPRELCEWLANAGWDAEKCCNPKLSIAEKKLSTDPPTTTQHQQPATPRPVDGGQEAANTPPDTPEGDEEITPASPEVAEKVERPQTPTPPQLSGFASSYNHQFDPDDCPRLEMLWRSTPAPSTEDREGQIPPPKMRASKRHSADDHGESDQHPKRQRTSMLPGDPLGVSGSFTPGRRSNYQTFPSSTTHPRGVTSPRQNFFDTSSAPQNTNTRASSLNNPARPPPPTPFPSATFARATVAPPADQALPGTRTPQPTTIPSTPMRSQPPTSDQSFPPIFHDMMSKMADMSAAVTAQVQLRDEEHHHHKDRLRRAFLAVEHASREVGRAGNAFDIARRDLDMALEQQNVTIVTLKTLLDTDEVEAHPVHLDEPEALTRERESSLPQLFGTLSHFSMFMVLHVTHTFILLGYFLTQGGFNFFKYLRQA
ncbi:hypothetical protein GCG54_00012493 [Colletotrichum gloeosporioides]|uniref:Uncharacterized protein n=1 Tax=Colletotrichum gloeosporioides TaxID=474922 RepID=A0A8H4CDX9_COLGL|nr:uncharacterized protein GCG54_00012493 [Colletotrichum gloeosporioides]KAF3802245.1 hypothetical protein GCG54_00012493 [Colletotrichum gloeosporioides]